MLFGLASSFPVTFHFVSVWNWWNMKPLILITLTFVAFTVSRTHGAVLAGPLTNAANRHVYYLVSSHTWTAAEAEAVGLGGHLVTINDAAEQQWVANTFLPLAGTRYLWIGLTDRDVEGTYQWVSGETSTYRNWQLGEPNNAVSGNYNQDYAHLYPANDAAAGKWDDRSETEAAAATAYGIAEVIPGVASQVAILPAIEIAWTSQSTNSYQLQWGSSLNTNNWFSLGVPIPGTGSTNYYLDSTRAADKRFYRVLTLP
jgi:hypothetical protein